MGASAARADVVTRYRRRDVGEPELELIRGKITELGGQPGGRKGVAAAICEAWDWRQPRGTLATRACVDLLLRLEEWGHIELPAARGRPSSGPRRRNHPLLPRDLIPLTGLEIRGDDVDLSSLVVRPIAAEEREGWRLYMGRYHDLGDRPIVGEDLLYVAVLGGELVALLGWASAAFRAPLREAYIGWDDSAKRERLHLVADNVRFLMLPWVRVPHLASKILATNLRRLSGDWERTWGHPIHLAETFVDSRRFRGTCYRASNWIYLGQTAGRSKRGNAYLHEGSSKALFVYPLRRHTRRLLAGGSPPAASAPSSTTKIASTTTASTIEIASSTMGEVTVLPLQGVEPSPSRPVIVTSEEDARTLARARSASPAQDAEERDPDLHGPRASLVAITATLTAVGAGPDGTTVLSLAGPDDPGQAVSLVVKKDEPDERSAKAQRNPRPGGSLATLTAALTAFGPRDELPLDQPDDEEQVALRAAEAPRESSTEVPPSAPSSKGTNRTRIQIELTGTEREALEKLSRGLTVPHRQVVRAKIILLLAAGGSAAGIARKVGCARRIIERWGERFVRKRLDGLVDDERSGRPARFSPRSRNSPGQAGLRAP